MRYAWLALILAGCGAELGGPCSATDSCEAGVCDLTDPMGPVCIESDGDVDGDGIPNDKDFCNHQAGGDFDEDRDGFGDVCDRCPVAPPAGDDPEPDGDEVDSPCDPDPTVGGDRIVVFDGFNSGLPAGFKASAGWQFVGGEAIAMPPDTLVIEQITAPLPLVSQEIAVLGQYRIDRVDAQATENFAGVIAIDQRPAGGSVVQCTGTRTAGTDRLLLDTDMGIDTSDFTNLFDSASLYRIALQLERADAGCAMIADEETGAAQARTSGEAMNEGGLVAKGATARFQFLLVVQRAP